VKRRHSIVRVFLATLAESVMNSWTCVMAVTVVMVASVYLSMRFHRTDAIAHMVSQSSIHSVHYLFAPWFSSETGAI